MPDLPHLAVRLGSGRAVPGRRCGAAQAQERQRAFRRERKGACELTLRLRRTPSLEQHLTKQLRSEEHTSELQSRLHLVCRLLLEKKKRNQARSTLPIAAPVRTVQSQRSPIDTN